MTCSHAPPLGITATPRQPMACAWRPAVDLRDDERSRYRGAVEGAVVEIGKQRVVIASLHELVTWALGDGPLPRDEAAELAACQWFSMWVEDDHGDPRLASAFRRVRGLLVDGLHEVAIGVPALTWIETIARLEMAAAQRRAMGCAKETMRALCDGDSVRAMAALRRAQEALRDGFFVRSDVLAQSIASAA
jgi:hypothetical protein